MASTAHEDRRRFQRILFDASSTLTIEDNSYQSKLLDISLNGALMELPGNWRSACGDQGELNVHLAEDMKITMTAEVTHMESHQVGLRCVHIDMDSISHLRRLVELNLGDASLLERELSALGESESD